MPRLPEKPSFWGRVAEDVSTGLRYAPDIILRSRYYASGGSKANQAAGVYVAFPRDESDIPPELAPPPAWVKQIPVTWTGAVIDGTSRLAHAFVPLLFGGGVAGDVVIRQAIRRDDFNKRLQEAEEADLLRRAREESQQPTTENAP